MTRRRKVGIALLAIVGTVLTALRIEWVNLGLADSSDALQTQLRLARQDGIPVVSGDLYRVTVPSKQNAAFGIVRVYDDIKKLPGDPLSVITGRNVYSNITIEAALTQISAQLKEVKDLSRRASFDMRWDWSKGIDLMFPEGTATKALVRCQSKRADVERANGKFEAAWNDLLCAARLSALLEQDPSNIGFVVRLACEATVLSEAGNVLRSEGTDSKGLQNGLALLGSLGPTPDIRRSYGGEVVLQRIILRQVVNWQEAHANEPDPYGDYIIVSPPADRLLKVSAVVDLNDANMLQDMRTIYSALPTGPSDIPRAVRQMDDLDSYWTALEKSRVGLRSIGYLFPSYDAGLGSLNGWISAIARRRVFEAGVHILLAKGQTGSFPDRWTGTGPESIDPFMNKPLTYRRTKPGFVVYSFGPDRKDDGGRPYSLNGDYQKGLDISFEYPTRSVRPVVKPSRDQPTSTQN